MTIEDLRRWRNAEPFVPFRIVVDSGSATEVWHQWNIAFGNGVTTCIVTQDTSDAWSVIDLSHIVAIESIPQSLPH